MNEFDAFFIVMTTNRLPVGDCNLRLRLGPQQGRSHDIPVLCLDLVTDFLNMIWQYKTVKFDLKKE